jgi:sec-independent protein translocase protein TatB
MFDISGLELAVVAAVVIMVFGPKELPGLLRQMGQLMGKARAMSRHLRSGIDEMIRQAELEEMEKQWREQNARIMAEHPPGVEAGAWPAGADAAVADGTQAGAADGPGPVDPLTGRPLREPPPATPPPAADTPQAGPGPAPDGASAGRAADDAEAGGAGPGPAAAPESRVA